jgi:hypothetical protein
LLAWSTSTETYILNAAIEYWKVLNYFDFNLSQALQAQHNSPLNFGSEFKDLHILSTIMDDHPLWDFASEILANGASYPLKDIPTDIRTTDVQFFIDRGNHKSAMINNSKVQELLLDHVTRGFSLILPLDAAHHLKGISISPLGCQEQDTINDQGEIIKKNCLTHDQSFPGYPEIHQMSESSLRNSLHANMEIA